MTDIIAYLQTHAIAYEENVELRKHTWIHRGGVARLWITPESCDQLQTIGTELYRHSIKFQVIGHSSNLYFDNNFNPPVIISTAKLTRFLFRSDMIECECGVSVKSLAKEAVEQGISGFEGLVDLPGTIAAAVCNNSGCYGCDVSSLLHHVEFLQENGQVVSLSHNDLCYAERTSALKRKQIRGIILKVYLNIHKSSDAAQIRTTAQKNHLQRITYQERPAQTLGSIFPKNVMTAFEKNLPLHTKIPIILLNKLFKLHCISYFTRQQQKRNIICLLNGLWDIRDYISKKNFNCFIWKDDKADEAFLRYRSFVQNTAKDNQIEIETINRIE